MRILILSLMGIVLVAGCTGQSTDTTTISTTTITTSITTTSIVTQPDVSEDQLLSELDNLNTSAGDVNSGLTG